VQGGIMLWKDEENYLYLDWGSNGRSELAFMGCLANQDVIIGRGRLVADRVTLRLERTGDQVAAFCTADGETWYTVGHATFDVEGPVEIGLYAIGTIDRTPYPGTWPDGTAIRFESFALQELDTSCR
jgi:regulation of enolase protein 1 (concanavalin A-like superfamily)